MLAAEEENREQLVPLFQADDSGIDSDDTDRVRAQLNNDGLIHLTETSSSDEDIELKMPLVRSIKKEVDDQLKTMEEGRPEQEVLLPLKPWRSYCDDILSPPSTPDRFSPPLYEVELTASDEDDDTSVLELVIPLQSRYRAGSSQNAIAASIFCSLLCCFRN